jgi:hypothetical protein
VGKDTTAVDVSYAPENPNINQYWLAVPSGIALSSDRRAWVLTYHRLSCDGKKFTLSVFDGMGAITQCQSERLFSGKD